MYRRQPQVLADILFVGVNLNERLAGPGNGKTAGRLLVQSTADHDDEIRLVGNQVARVPVRVGQVADVIGMAVGESVLAFISGQHRHLKLLGKID
jgi:hypothetical protein